MNSTTNLGFSNSTVTGNQKRYPLTIIIVSWNVKELLRNCLRSLVDDRVPDWAEVIVFDNNSADETIQMVAGEFPWVKLLANSQNLGFSRANNAAWRQSDSDFVFLLNPDTLVHRGAIRKLVDFAVAHPEVAVVGPKLCNADGSTQFEGGVELPTIWNVFCDLALLSEFFPHSRFFCRRKMGYWDHEGDREVPGVSGAAMLVRSDILDRIGFLNETLFYTEDMDFCSRVRKAGRSVYYLGSASLVHYGGGSTKSVPDQGFQRQIAFQSTWLYTNESHGRIFAAALTAMIVFWSISGILATSVLGVFCRRNTPAASKVARFREIAVNLLRWAFSNKKKFHHHLAAPPKFDAAGNPGTN